MHRAMPQLNALRAFEAAARHLSLTKAAVELNVTAGALSHQIRGLEELLGLQLFERRVRQIALTRAGTEPSTGRSASCATSSTRCPIGARATRNVSSAITSPARAAASLTPSSAR